MSGQNITQFSDEVRALLKEGDYRKVALIRQQAIDSNAEHDRLAIDEAIRDFRSENHPLYKAATVAVGLLIGAAITALVYGGLHGPFMSWPRVGQVLTVGWAAAGTLWFLGVWLITSRSNGTEGPLNP